jgi:hypothetical protein
MHAAAAAAAALLQRPQMIHSLSGMAEMIAANIRMPSTITGYILHNPACMLLPLLLLLQLPQMIDQYKTKKVFQG